MPYLAKDGNELANILSLVKAADEQIRKYPSVADDSGTEARRSQHLLTRLLNCVNGQVEVGGQTAALALLGFPSNIMSHGFVFVYIRAAIAFAQSAHAQHPPPLIEERPTRRLQEVLELNNQDDDEIFVDGERNEDDDLSDDDGACDIGTTNGTIALVPQHLDYANRGASLSELSFFQWCGIVCVTDKKAPRSSVIQARGDDDGNDSDENLDDEDEDSGVVPDAEEGARATSQRQHNKVFPFSVLHSARSNKTQRLHTKQLVCHCHHPHSTYIGNLIADPNYCGCWCAEVPGQRRQFGVLDSPGRQICIVLHCITSTLGFGDTSASYSLDI